MLYEIAHNYEHGSYSIMPELFLFWIAECCVEKKEVKNLETSTMNIITLAVLYRW